MITHDSYYKGITRLSRYSPSMKALNSQFRLWGTNVNNFNNDAQYLFFFEASPSGGGLEGASLAGDMPRGKQFGYLFGSANAQTAAHELGHGIFRLAHTFDDYGYAQSSTPNLMDYPSAGSGQAGGKELVKYQWDILHDVGIAGWLDDADEGQSVNTLLVSHIKDIIDKIKQANSSQKTELTLQLTSALAEYNKIKLGEKDFSYIKMVITGVNPLINTSPQIGYSINPGELTKTNGKDENGINIATYQFHDKSSNQISRIKVIVREEESSDFEEYVFGEVISIDILKQIFEGANNGGFIEKCQPFFNKYMKKFEINTPLRVAHFLAQVGVECGYFRGIDDLKENLSDYTSCNIKFNLCQKCYSVGEKDVPKCPSVKGDCLTKYSGSGYNENRADMCEHPDQYAFDGEKIAMAAYSGYIGRGFIHITLKENYSEIYHYLISNGCTPKDYLTNPLFLSDDIETAVMSACAFFTKKGCCSQADMDNFGGVMNLVNASDTNRGEKSMLLQKIKGILKIQ